MTRSVDDRRSRNEIVGKSRDEEDVDMVANAGKCTARSPIRSSTRNIVSTDANCWRLNVIYDVLLYIHSVNGLNCGEAIESSSVSSCFRMAFDDDDNDGVVLGGLLRHDGGWLVRKK